MRPLCQIHLPQNRKVARVGAERIEKWVSLDWRHHVVARVNGPIQPTEAFDDLAQPEVDQAETGGRHLSFQSQRMEVLKQVLRFAYVPALSQGQPEPPNGRWRVVGEFRGPAMFRDRLLDQAFLSLA